MRQRVCLFVLSIYVLVNIFSAMLGPNTKQRIKCFAQGHNTVPPVSEARSKRIAVHEFESVIKVIYLSFVMFT